MDEEAYKFHRTLIYCIIVFFQVFGLIGNYNLLMIHVKTPTLRTKYGCLLCSMVFCQSLCLLCEINNYGFGLYAMLNQTTIARPTCLYALTFYIMVFCVQTAMTFAIALDLFVSITFPFKHRKLPVEPYVMFMWIPGLTYGIFCVISSYIHLTPDQINMCNPPAAMGPIVSAQWYRGMIGFIVMTALCYGLAYSIIFWKSRTKKLDEKMIEKKAMKTLKYLLLILMVFRFWSTMSINIVTWMDVDPAIIKLLTDYNVVDNLFGYSQNAYVCAFCSMEYRRLICRQAGCLKFLFSFGHIEESKLSGTNIAHSTSAMAKSSVVVKF